MENTTEERAVLTDRDLTRNIDTKTGERAFSTDRELTENMSQTLQNILDVLRGSTIAEELGEDVQSKFWATYKKVSDDYDKEFLERANDDMAIILTFAGLSAVVDSTFIVGMQPNPVNTTNDLLLGMMQIMANGPDAVNISNFSSSTLYSYSAWIQALSFASLAFSVLAAFGAVMGKQWLNSYKAARGRGSLEERGTQRQKKFDALESWKLQTILKVLLILLQISLFLFGLSLSANMWTLQKTISIAIICVTAFGVFFYVATTFVAVLYPDSPFQTAESALARKILSSLYTLPFAVFDALLHIFPSLYRTRLYLSYHDYARSHAEVRPDTSSIKSSAVRWLLEASTNPDVVEAAAAMVPLAQWQPESDASAIYARLRDTFTSYPDREELFVKCGKAMAHLCVQPVKISSDLLRPRWDMPWGDQSRFIHDAFMAASTAWDKSKMMKKNDQLNPSAGDSQETKADDRDTLEADVRTALRTMVVYGRQGCMSRPNDTYMIWFGDLQWRGIPGYEKFDWLIDYLVDKVDPGTDEETVGDSLLALSAMHGLGGDSRRRSYVEALICCMTPTKPPRVRYAALRVISDAREELLSIRSNSMPQGVDDNLLDELSRALLTTLALGLDDDEGFGYGGIHCYLRLIHVLTKNDEWRQRLIRHEHVQKCTSLLSRDSSVSYSAYIAGICLQVNPSGNDPSLSPIRERWGELMRISWKRLWHPYFFMDSDFNDYLETLPALVTATKESLSGSEDGVAGSELRDLAKSLDLLLSRLQRHNGPDSALSVVQNFYDDLRRMFKLPDPTFSSKS